MKKVRRAKVFLHGGYAGLLIEDGSSCVFQYDPAYVGPPVSLTMPVRTAPYRFDIFPPFFDGLLPEGIMLEGLLRQRKIDRLDLFTQLVSVGRNLVGAVTVEQDV